MSDHVNDYAPDLPHDIGAEQATVGAALLDERNEVLGQILEIAPPGAFYRPAHGEILALIQELADQGKPHDVIAVNGELMSRGRAMAVGGLPHLQTLAEAVPAVANGPYYANKVAEFHTRREIITAGTRMAQIGRTGEGGIEELVADAMAAPDSITTGPIREDTLKGLAAGFMEHMDGLDQGRPEVPTIPLPFADLQALLGGGLARGQLVTIGALSSHGKTVLGLDIARCAARAGTRVLVHSLEMPHEQIQERITSAETSIVSYRLRVRPTPAEFTAEEMARLADYASRVQTMDLDIDDASDVGLATVRARLASLERRGRKPELVVIDYLQLMQTTKEDRRDLEIGRITRGLKLLAKDQGICIVLLAQISKDVASRADKDDGRSKARLEDFRESATIGHDSDIAIMIENHNITDPEGPLAGTATLHVVKNRMGSQGSVQVGVQFHYSRFNEIAPG
jgi:replicative DNA helicase